MAHSDHRKAEALAVLQANGGNVAKTARQLGIPRATITLWRDGGVSEDVTESCQGKKQDLADALEALVWKCVECLPDKLANANAKDAATVMGIATEKMQLLRERPTSIQKTETDLTPEERARRVAELLDAGESRAGEKGPDPGRSRGTGPAARVVS
jgi:transposase-like protein